MKKMYIIVKQELISHKPLAIAHGVLMCHLKFQDDPDYQDWLKNSFRKVVCDVQAYHFDYLKSIDKNVIVTESALDNIEVGIVFCPRDEWPKPFKFYGLLK